MLFRLYLAIASLNAPLWRLVLKRRIKRGKEDPARVQEKLGHTSQPRPDGPLIWFHALSVGESLALLTLIKRLGEELPDVHFLLTTGTKTSVETLENVGLPPRVIHQYFPADARGPVQRFLNHWHPDIAAFAEADLWPYMISRLARRRIPLLLINARVADESYRRRMKTRGIYRHILPMFTHIFAQDALSADRLLKLGAPTDRLQMLGPLKSASDPLPDSPKARAAIQTRIANRPVWLAASTHIREEDQLFTAHNLARQKIPDLLMIIAPRNIDQADKTETLARAEFTHVSRRSHAEPITAQTEVYIADTLGEMGLWYRIAPVAFIGHSMPVPAPKLVGKNPYEALALGAYVLHGPDYADFTDIYTGLMQSGASVCVADSTALADEIVHTLLNFPYPKAAESNFTADCQALDITLEMLRDMITKP